MTGLLEHHPFEAESTSDETESFATDSTDDEEAEKNEKEAENERFFKCFNEEPGKQPCQFILWNQKI